MVWSEWEERTLFSNLAPLCLGDKTSEKTSDIKEQQPDLRLDLAGSQVLFFADCPSEGIFSANFDSDTDSGTTFFATSI